MKFTVIIPLYNKEKHIGRAINSIINQTYQEFEIIVIDDGSTDNSHQEVVKFKDSRIRLIRKMNGGVSSARNQGIDEAKYDYIGFLDADDAWKPEFLHTIKTLIEKHTLAGAYAMAYEIKKEDGSVNAYLYNEISAKNWSGIIVDYFKATLKNPLITASSVVIPKKVFDNLGNFPLGIKNGEDLDMWRRIALNYDIVYSNRIGATYFHDTDNRACNSEIRLEDTAASYAEELLIEAKESKSCSFYYEEYLINRIFAKVAILIKNNKRSAARKILYQYKYTKLNRKTLLRLLVSSLTPNTMKNLRNKFNRYVFK